MTPGAPAIFLDKDGTLIPDIPFNVQPSRIVLSPGAERLAALAEAGFRVVVVSNQSGVARGLFPESALAPVEARLRALLSAVGVHLDGFYYCPHHPRGSIPSYAYRCECRKPSPGMLQQAASDLGVDLPRSWMVGDILDDVAAGLAAGCRTVLIDNGSETAWQMGMDRRPTIIAPDLGAALSSILKAGGLARGLVSGAYP